MLLLIILVFGLFILIMLVGLYALQQIKLYDSMWNWLHKQHIFLSTRADFNQDAEEIINEDMPTIENYSRDSILILFLLLVTQTLNTTFLFSTLLSATPQILNILVAIMNAGAGWTFMFMRRRRYKAEGTCKAVQAVVESVGYFEEYKDQTKQS